jgi:hypothetical protein
VLLAVLTVIATIGQLPAVAAETGGAGGVQEAPVVQPPSRPLSASLPSKTNEIDPGPAP